MSIGDGSATSRPPGGMFSGEPSREARGLGRLGPLLVWALVFADLGSSIYFVPGILYRQVGALAPAFVLLATAAFVIIALEHLEITHRFPRGGGGVAAAVEAFGPRVGVVSGAMMVSAYLLTIALSVVSAVQYLAAIRPFPHEVGIVSAVVIVAIGVLNSIGVREAARVALVAALAALAADVVLLVVVLRQQGLGLLFELTDKVGQVTSLPWTQMATGFAGAWLAYSGLESLGQMAPIVRRPRTRVVRIATGLIIVSVVLTAPLFTALAVQAAGELAAAGAGGRHATAALLAPVALAHGGRPLLLLVAVTGAALLLVAANFAFIGCYNVFQAIGELGYLPAAVARRDSATGIPRGAVVVITLLAFLLVIFTRADLDRMGQLFAFGLLGSYSITALSVDLLRWREKKRGLGFAFGLLASLALLVPWLTSVVTKWQATVYGAGVAGALLAVALATRRGWIRAGRFGFLRAASAEEAASEHPIAGDVLTLAEASDGAIRGAYPSTTLVALRGHNPALCIEAARRARGAGDTAVCVVYVDEIPGLVFPAQAVPSSEARRVLGLAARDLRQEGMETIPIWRLAHDAGAAIAEAAVTLGVRCVMVGTTQRSTVWHFLRGHVLKRLMAELPDNVRVVICE